MKFYEKYKVKDCEATREVCPELIGLTLPFIGYKDNWIWLEYKNTRGLYENRFFGASDVEGVE